MTKKEIALPEGIVPGEFYKVSCQTNLRDPQFGIDADNAMFVMPERHKGGIEWLSFGELVNDSDIQRVMLPLGSTNLLEGNRISSLRGYSISIDPQAEHTPLVNKYLRRFHELLSQRVNRDRDSLRQYAEVLAAITRHADACEEVEQAKRYLKDTEEVLAELQDKDTPEIQASFMLEATKSLLSIARPSIA